MDLDTFLRKRKKSKKKEKKKKERKKKGGRRKGLLCVVFNTACWLNKADSLKGKEKRKKDLFLKSHNYLFGLIKALLHFKCSLVLKSIGYVVYLSSLSIEMPSFALIFFSFVSLSFILAKGLIRLKNISRKILKFDYSEIYFVLT